MTTRLETLNLGELEFREEDVILFVRGIPGLENLRRFILAEGERYAPLAFLQSVENPAISLPVLDPTLIWKDYSAEIPEEERRRLQLEDRSEALVFCVVTMAEEAARTTVNLFAPLVVNPSRRLAVQIMLAGSRYRIDQPLVESAACSSSREKPEKV